MSNTDHKDYVQIVELTIAIKKKLCSTWRSSQLDNQAIADLKFAISKKKDILDQNGISIFDKLVKDFESWVYETDPVEDIADSNGVSNSTMGAVIASQSRVKTNTQTI